MPATIVHIFFYFLSLLQDGAKDFSLSSGSSLFSMHSTLGQAFHRRGNQTSTLLRGSDLPKPVHVVYSSDARTFSSMLVSMLSLARSLSTPSSCTIHLIVAESDLTGAENLVRRFHAELQKEPSPIAKQGAPAVVMYQMKSRKLEHNSSTTTAPAWVQRFWQTPAAYVRLHLHEYLPVDITQVLWLDTDTVIQSDISHLVRKPLVRPIGAVYDKKSFAAVYPEWVSEAANILPSRFDKDKVFFNSGVLMVNLAMWRKLNVDKRLEEVAHKIPGADDQFLLNMVFYHDFDILDEKWNFLGLGEPSSFWDTLHRPSLGEVEAAHILHFTGVCKPSPDANADQSRCTSEYAQVYQKYCIRDQHVHS